MNVDPNKGVCNDQGRVFGIKNLWISGPSLFPTYGFANPMLTIIALSFRQVDLISNAIKHGK